MITAILSALVIVILRMDYIWLANGLGEKSLTESFQSLLILFIVFSFYQLSQKSDVSSAAMLVCGFFCVLFIREADGYLDKIMHGFWLYPALTVALFSILFALRKGNSYKQFSSLLENNNMQALITFTVLLFVFSRLYGMSEFWLNVMGEDFVRDVKNISEETSELMCYGFIAFYAYKTKKSLLCMHK